MRSRPSTREGSALRSPSLDPPPYDASAAGSPPPIVRRSSSNLLRAFSKPDPATRHAAAAPAPYRPAPELQRHIDALGSTISPLTLATSNTQTEYFDMLPSFQMFQLILKRDNAQFSENLTIDPPVYGDTSNSSATPPALSPQTSHNDYFYQQQRDHNLDAAADGIEVEAGAAGGADAAADAHHPSNIAASHDTYGHTVLDNIDRLPKLHNSPIDIQIHVTKDIPQPHVASDAETRLKEYSSGDVVNGYITITNTADKPVDFGMFLVTLEGTVKATERVNAKFIDAGKIKRILMKKFLKMYDLNALYGYGYIPRSAGVEYDFMSRDQHDGAVLGLPDERVLQPGVKYKKFFTFKFPEKLLDNSCINAVLPHVLPPPSMGVDRTCFYNRGSAIVLNRALGYGFMNVKGTPLLTKDYGFDDVSVAYTIEAKFIDKLHGHDGAPLLHQDINDPSADLANYVISKLMQYFLRFIPDLSRQLHYYNHDSGATNDETFASVGIDGKLYHTYLLMSTWRHVTALNHQIERNIDAALNHAELSAAQIKHKSLLVRLATPPRDFSVKNQILQQLAHTRTRELEIDDNLYYRDERMIGCKTACEVFGKKKKKILLSLIRIGTLKLFVRVPDTLFSYLAPKLLMKYNMSGGGSGGVSPALSPVASNDSQFAHSRGIDATLTPMALPGLQPVVSATNMMELYRRSLDAAPHFVDIRLVFTPIDNSILPPKISLVEANVVLWTYNTEYPLPFIIGYDFFYCSPNDDDDADDDVAKTRANIQQLKDRAYNYIQYLKANKTMIPRESFMDLKAIQLLTFKKDTIKDYFRPLTHTSHPQLLNEDHEWKARQSKNNTQKLMWSKDLKIPLEIVNKYNVNLLPSFQNCLVGRIYCLQIVVKYKGSASDQKEFADNVVKVDVPILVG